MIARYIEQWKIQEGQQVFQVRIRQVSTAEDEFDLVKVPASTKSIKSFDNLIADCEYLHNERIVPQNGIPCKGL